MAAIPIERYAEEGGHDVMSKQLLVHSNNISRARIVDTNYKNSSMDQVSIGHSVFD